MGIIRLQHVVSFSSQDDKHPVENIMTNLGDRPTKPWLCSPLDKSGLLEAEFQTDRAVLIHYVDVGNYGCCTIEILVGRSSWPVSKKYVTLLPAVNLMTFAESKNAEKRTSVRMFAPEDLNNDTTKEKWDRIRVICCQPFRKDMQFGLSFIRFGNKDPIIISELADKMSGRGISCSDDKQLATSPSFGSSAKRLLQPKNNLSMTFSRGYNMMKSAKTQYSKDSQFSRNAKASTKTHYDSFEEDVLLFLTSLNSDYVAEQRSFKGVLQFYETERGVELTDEQRNIFENLMCNISLSCLKDKNVKNNEKSFSNNDYAEKFPYSDRTKLVMSDTTLRKRILNQYNENYSEEKDVEASTLHRKVGHQQKYSRSAVSSTQLPKSENEISLTPPPSDSTPSELPVFDLNFDFEYKKSKFDASPFQSNTNGCKTKNGKRSSREHDKKYFNKDSRVSRSERSLEFDSNKPTTSSELTYIECPLCCDLFHRSDIEEHAATCVGSYSEDLSDTSGQAGTTKSRDSVGFGDNSSASETLVECPICGNFFGHDEVVTHADLCVENCL